MRNLVRVLMMSILGLGTVYANSVATKAYEKAESFSKQIKNSSNKKELYKKATKEYRIACKNGNNKACNMIVDIALLKLNTDIKQSVNFLKLACENNNAEACGLLSDIYSKGVKGIKQDKALALKLLKKSSKLGYSNSSLLLAKKYILGKGVKKDIKSGLKILNKLCNNGQNRACIVMATMKYNGVYGVKKDKSEALKLLTSSCLSKGRDSGEACYKKALVLADLSKNIKKGKKLDMRVTNIIAIMKSSCELGYKQACKYSKMKVKN